MLTYTCEKGKDSAFRPPSIAVVPVVPELEALIAELPRDQFVFIHSEHGRPYSCTESLGNRIRKWRRAAGLPEGLSAHSMRKAATHWWLRNHRDLIANNFSLKTVFGWATDKRVGPLHPRLRTRGRSEGNAHQARRAPQGDWLTGPPPWRAERASQRRQGLVANRAARRFTRAALRRLE